MKTTIIISALIISLSILLGIYLYTENTRYDLEVSGITVFKIDKKTGQMWGVYKGKEQPIEPKDD